MTLLLLILFLLPEQPQNHCVPPYCGSAFVLLHVRDRGALAVLKGLSVIVSWWELAVNKKRGGKSYSVNKYFSCLLYSLSLCIQRVMMMTMKKAPHWLTIATQELHLRPENTSIAPVRASTALSWSPRRQPVRRHGGRRIPTLRSGVGKRVLIQAGG